MIIVTINTIRDFPQNKQEIAVPVKIDDKLIDHDAVAVRNIGVFVVYIR